MNKNFRDLKDSPLEERVGDIIYKIFVVGNRLFAEYKLEELIEERKWEEQKRKRKLEQLRNDELEEVKELTQAISDWNKASKIRKFTDEFVAKVRNLKGEDQKERLLKWIQWARDKADWVVPLSRKRMSFWGRLLLWLNRLFEHNKIFVYLLLSLVC